jgi:hypothetical protein
MEVVFPAASPTLVEQSIMNEIRIQFPFAGEPRIAIESRGRITISGSEMCEYDGLRRWLKNVVEPLGWFISNTINKCPTYMWVRLAPRRPSRWDRFDNRYFWHITSARNKNLIAKRGLRASDRVDGLFSHQNRIYASTVFDISRLRELFKRVRREAGLSSGREGRFIIYQIDRAKCKKGGFWYRDWEAKNSAHADASIPPKAIRIVYEGS